MLSITVVILTDIDYKNNRREHGESCVSEIQKSLQYMEIRTWKFKVIQRGWGWFLPWKSEQNFRYIQRWVSRLPSVDYILTKSWNANKIHAIYLP